MIPKDLKYTADHEWVKVEGNKIRVGITDYAQRELGDIVFVDLPAVGEKITTQDMMVSIESIKTASEINAPVAGEVMDTNDNLEHSPELVNQDPYGKGWIAIIEPSDPADLKGLMNAAEYAKLIGEK